MKARVVEVLDTTTCEQQSATAMVFGPWFRCAHASGAVSTPDQLDDLASDWKSAAVPGTVAHDLLVAGEWDMQHPPEIDKQDWWYRTTFAGPGDDSTNVPFALCFDGLASIAEVWLNGTQLGTTDNMFRAYRFELSQELLPHNELAIVFRSVTTDLQKKRPRPRWKTNLVNNQQLRWKRMTLLGRIPGWCPPVPTIGPWRDIRIEQSLVTLRDPHWSTSVNGTTGHVSFRGLVRSSTIDRVIVRVGDVETIVPGEDLELVDGNTFEVRTSLEIPNAPLWWPHTHGEPRRLPCEVVIESNAISHKIECGRVGFRTVRVHRDAGFSIEVNGEPIYCRGSCWTVSDIFTVHGTEQSLRHDLTLARDAGANMLRVVGTMAYESDLFYDLCDELGIFVWQDFMFANMDYPVDDPSFLENIRAEATEQLRRLSAHPSVVVYCGNSEIEQQAAMLGMPRDLWSNHWFRETLPTLCEELHPGTVYVPSTPTGGVLPFHPSDGITHFYGVGAYLRSPAELRQADVKFTPECLGFSNIPHADTINLITEGATLATHNPKWKQRVPRDTGAGWDFEDVRDHYLKFLFGQDPVALRSSDMRRYVELSRVVPGEMMARTFSEWRSLHSHNAGALTWFYKDLWPAAGWGSIDSLGTPKATYYFLKRSWQPRQVVLTDEGLNGMHLHVVNESNTRVNGFVEIQLLKEPNVVVAKAEQPIELAARGRRMLNADEMLGGFYDVSYAYRFGPAHHDIVVATLFDADRNVISEAFHFIKRRESNVVPAMIETTVEATNGEIQVTLQSDRFLHDVRIDAKGYLPSDNDFHLVPARTKVVRFRSFGPTPKSFRAEIEALNLETPVDLSYTPSRG